MNSVPVSVSPVNKNATPEAKALLEFLGQNYGKKIISGQMDLTWNDSVDMAQRVYNDTQKYPALSGFDFMNYGSSAGAGIRQTEEAIAWHNKGGIVTFCWHWHVKGKNGNRAFYTFSPSNKNGTDFQIPYDIETKEWNVKSSEYKQLIKGFDVVAKELAKLQKKNIPVLWRPLHEASGGWFWWGASGYNDEEKAERFIALYKLMYNYFTETKGLNNLLWVWNGQKKNWYPGDDFVDIIGMDIYDRAKDYSSKYEKYIEAVNYSDEPDKLQKIVALTENGTIPSPQEMAEDGAWWCYFMTWNDANGPENQNDSGSFWTGEYYNDNEHKKEVYYSDLVITLDDLQRPF